ncbi:MAG: C2H2-type zinc finger protein, partial [Candidatus Endonucleobacter bathymodioli]|nr:C2H2-type zinc finger protein [Candidatus Endonucleobacter bathymodioli]
HEKKPRPICDVCSKECNTLSSLKSHMMIHTGDRPFNCNVCYKTFITKQNAQRHMRKHTQEGYFLCNVCNNNFTAISSLKRHMSNIHKMATDPCVPDA